MNASLLPAASTLARSPTPKVALLTLLLALSVGGAGPAAAASFDLGSDSTSAQTLAAGQTGNVQAGKKLTVSGSTVAVTITGSNAALNNQGTILQTGTGRVIRDNTGVSNLLITNGSATNGSALMQSADADVIQMAKSPASVTLNNYGSMISLNASAGGSQAVDFSSIASGVNIINNYAGGLMLAYEADAVRPGVNGVLYNAGTIRSVTTSGSSSDGIDLQNNSGAQITNAGTGVITGGRHGITGGALDASSSFVAAISNQAGGLIQGMNGSGLNFDGFNALQLVTVTNHGTITGNGVSGDGDGIDVDGLAAITNTGVIRSLNAFSPGGSGRAFSEGISIGGGSILNSGTIEGLVSAGNANAVGRGITLAGNDIASGALAGTREAIYGNTVITNQAGGLIRGQSDSAIFASGAASAFTVTINNQAGAIIRGGGSSSAAIEAGLNKTQIVNAGLIDGSSSGAAVHLGAAGSSVTISGGQASVLGNLDGGAGLGNTLTLAPGAGNQFAYADSIANFARVEVQSGTVMLSGVSSYTGTTVVSGGTLVLDGSNRLSAASALQLAGGTLQIANAAGVLGQSFASFSLDADSILQLGGSSLSFGTLGTIASGASLTVLGYGGSGYALRLLGDYTANSSFLSLLAATTINGVAASYRYDGVYTDIGSAVAAVPEPQSCALMLAGLGVIGLLARRRPRP